MSKRKPANQAFVATYGRGVLKPGEPQYAVGEEEKNEHQAFVTNSGPAIKVRKAPDIEMSRRFDWRKHRFRMAGTIPVYQD